MTPIAKTTEARGARRESVGRRRTIVFLACTAPFVVVAALLVLILPSRMRDVSQQWLERRALAELGLLSNAVRPGLDFEDAEAVRELLARTASSPGGTFAVVWRPDRTIMASVGDVPASVGSMWPDRPTVESYDDEMRVMGPVRARGGATGLLEIGFDRHEVKAETADHWWLAAGAAATVLALGLLASALVAFYVTRHRETERALLRARESFRGLMGASPDPIYVVRDRSIVYVNSALLELLGYTTGASEDSGAHSLPSAIVPKLVSIATAPIDSASHRQLSLPRGSGGALTLDMTAGRLSFEGEPATVVIARDMTERRQIEARMAMTDRLASVGTLAAGVAHEINNPLTYVIGNAELMADTLQAARASGQDATGGLHPGLSGLDEALDMLKDIRDGAERVRVIVRDLKTFTRVDDDAAGPVDLRRVADSACNMAWFQIRHRARLVKDYAGEPFVDANPARLGQVVLNLLVNAAQAIAQGRAEDNEIRVAVRPASGGRCVVEVSDTGSGMPDDVRERIFDPFFTTKPVGEGTGLGLSICHHIVTSLGGTIVVASAPGKGTTFTVSLPASRGIVQTAPTASASVPAARRGKVLVVDDEPGVLSLIRRALSGENDVKTASGGAEALAELDSGERFDVVLLDLMMPGINGMDVHAEVRRRWPEAEPRLVFVTGGACSPKAQEFLKHTRALTLSKPIDAKALRELVRERVAAGAHGIAA